jgi:predicted methyltransferase
MTYFSLVDQSHKILANVIQPGDLAIDATVGNGHDTVFLAEAVGETGAVIGFDVQQQALENTKRILQQKKLQRRVRLRLQSHATIAGHIPAGMNHGIKAVMFNLGYLPGSDKSVITRGSTTLTALNGVLPRLAHSGGVISIVAYRGHQGGEEETQAVLEWGSRLPPSLYAVQIVKSPTSSEKSPLLMVVTKRG